MRASLTEVELQKIRESETRYPRLYGILVNVFYQKDEPTFTLLLDKADKKSRRRFSGLYLDLARFAGDMFVEAFFATDSSTGLVRRINPSFKDLDAGYRRQLGRYRRLKPPPGGSSATRSARNSTPGRAGGARFRQHAITRGKARSPSRFGDRRSHHSRRQVKELFSREEITGPPTPRWSIGAGGTWSPRSHFCVGGPADGL
jgi:hypothetical protein